ncbi:MAG: hypothetical protein Q7S21_01030 [archaeon]|nr:hypothetical protein [archaeon]
MKPRRPVIKIRRPVVDSNHIGGMKIIETKETVPERVARPHAVKQITPSIKERAAILVERHIFKADDGKHYAEFRQGDVQLVAPVTLNGRSVYVTARLSAKEVGIWQKFIKGKQKRPSVQIIAEMF